MNKIIGVDFDDVFVNLLDVWLKRYNYDYNDNLLAEQITQWDMIPFVKKQCGFKIYDYLKDPHLYDDVDFMPNAVEGVLSLQQLGYRTVFITATVEGQEGVKYRILKESGVINSKKDYYEAEDKSLICVDYLIDDRPLNVQNTRGTGILFNRPHNASFEWTLRFDTWKDIVGFIQFKETGEYIYD